MAEKKTISNAEPLLVVEVVLTLRNVIRDLRDALRRSGTPAKTAFQAGPEPREQPEGLTAPCFLSIDWHAYVATANARNKMDPENAATVLLPQPYLHASSPNVLRKW